MTNDEIIIASIEELAKNIEEIQKELHFFSPPKGTDLEPLISKFDTIEKALFTIVNCSELAYNKTNQIDNQVKVMHNMFKTKLPRVVHKYIEIKKPVYWIYGVLAYFLFSLSICVVLVFENHKLAVESDSLRANDLKYRFIKVYNVPILDLQKIASTTTDWIYYVDSNYKNKKSSMEKYVNEKEDLILKAFEAEQLARIKQNEANDAFNLTNKLKKESNSIKVK